MSKNYSITSLKQNRSHASNREKSNFQSLKSPVGRTQYLSLVNDDLIYYGNLNRYISRQFAVVVRKVARDLNFLLHFRHEDFWAEIQSSESLRKCLESCLQVFPNKLYGMYYNKLIQAQHSCKIQQIAKLQTFRIFRELMRIVLFIYHRMACESKKEEKGVIYDQWLLDIPKMLNLIGIYKQSNPKIVKGILNAIFQEIPQYANDVRDFVTIIKKAAIEDLFLDLGFEFTQRLIKQSTNFSNPVRSFTRNLIKSFFRIYDTFNTLLEFVLNFPTNYVMIFICQNELIIDLIDVYFQYLENIRGKWEFTEEFINKFGPIIEAIRQKMITFFIKSLDVLDQILSQEMNLQNWNKCLRVYSQFCKEFVIRNEVSRKQLWQNLMNILIQETPHRQFFRLQKYFSKKLNPQEVSMIEKCRTYEKQYRELFISNKNFSRQQILFLKLNSIKSYKEWKQFENFPAFGMSSGFLDDDDDFSMQLEQQDSILDLIQKQLVMKREKKVQPQNMQSIAKKTRYFPYFKDEQYNDDPLQESDQQQYQYMYWLGLGPIQDKYLQSEQEKNVNDDWIPRKTEDRYSISYNTNMNEKIPNNNDRRANPNRGYNNNNKKGNQNNKMKKKKQYIALDQLSISYINDVYSNKTNNNEKGKVGNLKIQKIQAKPNRNIVKFIQQSYQNSSLSIQVNDDDQTQNSIQLHEVINQANFSAIESEHRLSKKNNSDLDNTMTNIMDMMKQTHPAASNNSQILQAQLSIHASYSRNMKKQKSKKQSQQSHELGINMNNLSINTNNNSNNRSKQTNYKNKSHYNMHKNKYQQKYEEEQQNQQKNYYKNKNNNSKSYKNNK